jgi:hypothetical protein
MQVCFAELLERRESVMIQMELVSDIGDDERIGRALLSEMVQHYEDAVYSDVRIGGGGADGYVASLLVASIPVLITGIKASRDVLMKWLESRHRHIRVRAFGQEIHASSVSELEAVVKLLTAARDTEGVRTPAEHSLDSSPDKQAPGDAQAPKRRKLRKS